MATVNGTHKEPDYTAERLVMIRGQLQRRGITDSRVLQAMQEVPRHAFVPPEWRHEAYSDRPCRLPMTRRSRSPIWSLL
jgi:protein-L-isoaspartate(D-aspartate) O-methyltransferase